MSDLQTSATELYKVTRGHFETSVAQWKDFKGRTRRSEYWYFMLGAFALQASVTLLGGLILSGFLAGLISKMLCLALLVPTIAATMRRLHDTGKSGWWILANFLPVVGTALMVWFLIQPSDPNENQYGPSPKPLA